LAYRTAGTDMPAQPLPKHNVFLAWYGSPVHPPSSPGYFRPRGVGGGGGCCRPKPPSILLGPAQQSGPDCPHNPSPPSLRYFFRTHHIGSPGAPPLPRYLRRRGVCVPNPSFSPGGGGKKKKPDPRPTGRPARSPSPCRIWSNPLGSPNGSFSAADNGADGRWPPPINFGDYRKI